MTNPQLSESLNFDLFDRIPEGVCVLRSDFVVVFWNKTLESWTKIPRREIIGFPIDQYYSHFREPKYQGRLQQIFNGGPPIVFSAQLHKYLIPVPFGPDQLRSQQVMVTGLPNAGGQEFYAVLAIQDVTDLTHQSQAYRKMRDQALAEIQQRQHIEAALRESEARYAKIFEDGPLGMALIDQNHGFFRVNRRFSQMVGYGEEELTGLSVLEITHPLDREKTAYWLEELNRGNCESYRLEKRYCSKTQGVLWVMVTVSMIRNYDGQALYRLSLVEDITERKQSEEALNQAHDHLKRWVMELEQRNREITLLRDLSNALQASLTRGAIAGAIRHFVQALFPQRAGGVLISDQEQVRVFSDWGDALVIEQVALSYQNWLRQQQRRNGLCDCKRFLATLPKEYFYLPLHSQNQELGLFLLEGQIAAGESLNQTEQDLAETVAENIALALANLQLRETLHELSIRDGLTGLYNRRYLEEALGREIHLALRKGYPVGVIMLDVDHFKNFNDTYGHAIGDRVLQVLSEFLVLNIRNSDIACRYGGEELLLILPEASLENTQKRADQIRQGIKTLKIEHQGQTVGKITLSLGVACFPQHGLTWEAVIRAADQALYQAKATGRDRVVAFGPSIDEPTL
ncbi:sensor domain-containing diguanylate cyclase [Spirulina subsalsa]|uniref:sensor domain-containing diguanylate cyclase n=1 Tax=Spirulina subsalsa TaxID=54311 RepID=UPI0002FC0B88|nr:diguanylate cyclase [Spirulina subsalsa]